MKVVRVVRGILIGIALLLSRSPGVAQWVRSDAPGASITLACSADGGALMALGPLNLYSSTNWGASWSSNSALTAGGALVDVACSADGSSQAVLDFIYGDFGPEPGGIHSSKDAGLSWRTQLLPNGGEWWGPSATLACSADANFLVALSPDGNGFGFSALFESHDFGLTWPITNTLVPWTSIAVSGDGSRMFATSGSAIFISTNASASWTETTAPSHPWTAVACSADGISIAGAASDGAVCCSANGGQTWITNSLSSGLSSVACSAEGATVLVGGGLLYVSTNGGFSWIAAGVPNSSWNKMVMSADGSKLAAIGGAGIYTFQTTAKPVLRMALSGTEALLSWTVPSMPFTLQQSSSLLEASWTDVGVNPTLNLANLKNEITLQPGGGQMFYRLAPR